MSLDQGYLRHALLLATGQQLAVEEVTRLSRLLDVVDEGLAYVLLRRDGFADCDQLQAALAHAAARIPAPNRTARPVRSSDAVRAAQASESLRAALRAVVEQNLASTELSAGLQDAWREAAEAAGPMAPDALLHIRRPG